MDLPGQAQRVSQMPRRRAAIAAPLDHHQIDAGPIAKGQRKGADRALVVLVGCALPHHEAVTPPRRHTNLRKGSFITRGGAKILRHA